VTTTFFQGKLDNQLAIEVEYCLMANRWVTKSLALLFLVFTLSLSFHHHQHTLIDSNCPVCVFSLHSSNSVPESNYEVSAPAYGILSVLIEDQVVLPLTHQNIYPIRSPPDSIQS
jgi:hypothetical protein